MIICLIGFMGAGKSTIGKKLSTVLNYNFIDMDTYIEEKYKYTISGLFSLLGEDGFREIENKMLEEVLHTDNLVLAAGGGTPCFMNNMEIINNKTYSVYLKKTEELLFTRLVNSKKKRPLLQNLSETELEHYIHNLVILREPIYNLAKLIVNGASIDAQKLSVAIFENYKNDSQSEIYL